MLDCQLSFADDEDIDKICNRFGVIGDIDAACDNQRMGFRPIDSKRGNFRSLQGEGNIDIIRLK